MAKGNDSNYLQHSVEVAAATRLKEENLDGLHVALTHGMEPFEVFEVPVRRPPAGFRLKAALGLASKTRVPQEGEPAIVTAYRRVDASDQHYPNSAQLLRTIASGGLHGGIAEVCHDKHRALVDAWVKQRLLPARLAPSARMRVCCNSWREEVGQGGVLSCPDDLQVPWLFSMDPMTYKSGGSKDDDNLYESDLDLVSEALASFIRSGQPGIATLFVYNVWKEQSAFCQFAERLAKKQDLRCLLYSITHRGGNRNIVALLYAKLTLPKGFIEDAVEEIEDMALTAAMQASKREYATRKAVMDVLDGGPCRRHNSYPPPPDLAKGKLPCRQGRRARL